MTTPASLPFDARPLTDAADKQAIRTHTQQLREGGRLGSTSPFGIGILVAFGAVFVLVAGSIFGSFLAGAAGGSGAAVFPILLVIVAGAGFAIWRMLANDAAERRWRLDRFARANGMQWHRSSPNPPLPGMIFTIGSSRAASDIVRGDRPRFVEFGNHRYTTGSGKNKTTHKWGYVAVKLASPLPHIVLDATGNNTLFGSNLPASFDRDQRLSLEGDFDRYFSLYCPTGYERDALYLFTPDIMARFIDNAAALDVEIVDDWLFLYAKHDFSTLNPAVWAWLFSVVGALLDKLTQWERWRDDRLSAPVASTPVAPAPATSAQATSAQDADAAGVAHDSLPFAAPTAPLRPPSGVAQPGRRLQRRVPIITWIVGGVVVLVWFLQFAGGALFSVFGR